MKDFPQSISIIISTFTPHSFLHLLFLTLLFNTAVHSQFDPSAAFEVQSTTQGFLLPRMTQSELNAINDPAEGLMVICTDCGDSLGVYTFNPDDDTWNRSATANDSFYTADGGMTNSRTVSLSTHKLTFKSNNNQAALAIDGQNKRVGIGTASPTAVLEISSKDNGVLIPRLALTASQTYSLKGSPTEAMLVYNTETATNTGLKGAGFYSWQNNSWNRMDQNENLYSKDGVITETRTVSLTDKSIVYIGDSGALKIHGTKNSQNKDVVKNNSQADSFETFDRKNLEYINAQARVGFEGNVDHIFSDNTGTQFNPNFERLGNATTWGIKYKLSSPYKISEVRIIDNARNGLIEFFRVNIELYKDGNRLWTEMASTFNNQLTLTPPQNTLADEIRLICNGNCGGGGKYL